MSDGPNQLVRHRNLIYLIKRNRERAARCEEQARRAKDPNQRATFLRAAAVWTKAAEDIAVKLKHKETSSTPASGA